MHIAPFDNENAPIVDVDDATVPLNYFNIVKLDAVGTRDRDAFVRAAKAAAAAAKQPDLATTVDTARKKQKYDYAKARFLREREEQAQARRQANADLRNDLRNKYSLS